MEIKQVECFVAVAKKKSFSKAADFLFMSQPAVSSNIQNLERDLGVTLIDRKGKSITLTDAGKIFLRYAVEVISVCAKAENSISDYKRTIEGTLEICASTIPEQYLLPHIIKAFKEEYPLVYFSIRHKDSKEVAEEILSGRVNFGFIGARYSIECLEYIDFFDDKMVLITSPEKSFDIDSVCIKNLIGEDIVLREEGSGTRLLIENALKANRMDMNQFRSHIISDSLESIKRMVALGVGVSFISDVAVKHEVESGKLNKYEIKDLALNRNFSLVYCNNRYLSPVEEKFKEFVSAWKWDEIDI